MRARLVVLLLAIAIVVGGRGSERAPAGADPAGSGSAATSGSAAAAVAVVVDAKPAPTKAPAIDAPSKPLTLVEELRALPVKSGDRTKATAFHKQALKVHASLKYAESEQAWADAARADPSWTWPFYNLACTTAVQGRPLDAIAYLEMMRDRDPDRQMLWRVEHDGELESIRSRPEYESLVIEIEDGVRDREANPPAVGSGAGGAGSAGGSQQRRPK